VRYAHKAQVFDIAFRVTNNHSFRHRKERKQTGTDVRVFAVSVTEETHEVFGKAVRIRHCPATVSA